MADLEHVQKQEEDDEPLQPQHEHLQQLVDFDRESLKKAEIRVTSFDGRIHFEAAPPQPDHIMVETVKLDQRSVVQQQHQPKQQQQPPPSSSPPEIHALNERMKGFCLKPLTGKRKSKEKRKDANNSSTITANANSTSTTTMMTTASSAPLQPRPPTASSRGSWFVCDLHPDLEVAVILPGLTMGSQDAAASLDSLLAAGVTHVINLGCLVDNFFKEKLIYKTISARDIPEFKISSHFEEANDFIDEAIQANGVVFVHCNAGISRAGSIVTAYVMKTLRMGFESALAFVKSKRSVVKPNPGFVDQLKDYEKTLKLDVT